jgi:hypothetical protein
MEGMGHASAKVALDLIKKDDLKFPDALEEKRMVRRRRTPEVYRTHMGIDGD